MGPAEHEEGGSLQKQRQRNRPEMTPHSHAVVCANKQPRRREMGLTYRPRSVSSLLIRLSAIVRCVRVVLGS